MTKRNWLIIFQNNAELRPTGGFITAYAVISFRFGLPLKMFFRSSDQIQDPEDQVVEPPAVMAKVFKHKTPSLTFRDANCDPDFEVSVNNIVKLFNHEHPEINISRIIAVNFYVLERLIKHFRGIKINRQKITAQNLFSQITEHTSACDRHNLKSLRNRKNILKQVAKKLFFKALRSPLGLLTSPFLIRRLFQEKHLLMSTKFRQQSESQDSSSQSSTTSAQQNSLQVIETNLLGMKNDRYIQRSFHHHIEINHDLTSTCTTKVTLFHNGSENIPISGLYQGFFQQPDATKGQIIQLQPGETKTIEFIQEISISKNKELTLALIKQPGTIDDTVLVTVKAPIDFHFQSKKFQVAENSASYRTNLRTDKSISLKIQPQNYPPRITYHEIIELNQIMISFNKPIQINPKTASVNIYNAPPKNPQDSIPLPTEAITVGECEIVNNGTSIIIYTSGMIPQKEKFYGIKLNGITDLSGRNLAKRSQVFTVVNRLVS